MKTLLAGCALLLLAAPAVLNAAENASGPKTGVPAQASPSLKVDLNSADVAMIESLPGIGTEFANAVVAARPFKSVDDLQRVNGITPEKIARLRDRVVVTPPTTVAKADAKEARPASKSAPINDGRATPAAEVTERYDAAPAGPKPERK